MMRFILLSLGVVFFYSCYSPTSAANEEDDFLSMVNPDSSGNEEAKTPSNCLEIGLPGGYTRVEMGKDSFGHYLRNFSFRNTDGILYLYNGKPKGDQHGHFAILDIDVGTRDLQQCADAVMRLRGEFLFAQGKHDQIHFNFLNGKKAVWKDYAKGNYSHERFRKYMDWVFAYANTASLRDELKVVSEVSKNILPGDVFIQKGNPYGHAVIVMDVAIHNETGEKIFVLAQSYMPAQDIHVLNNREDKKLSPWHSASFANELKTYSWVFTKNDLRRFP